MAIYQSESFHLNTDHMLIVSLYCLKSESSKDPKISLNCVNETRKNLEQD